MTKGDQVVAVVGGQYGSEGKGVVVADLASKFNTHVRTGGPNAGHSFVTSCGITRSAEPVEFKMQQVPCGWINERADIVIGASAVVSPAILNRELNDIERYDKNIRSRVFVDYRATVLTSDDAASEGHCDGELHRRIGSTGEGVGSARIKRLRRDGNTISIVAQMHEQSGYFCGCNVVDTLLMLNSERLEPSRPKRTVLLEGTQGYGLSFNYGPWPFVTTSNCTAGQLAVDAGTRFPNRVVMVVRTFPIRVAGNSGPLVNEMTWDEVSLIAGRQVSEKTTVTRKTRRVGMFDMRLVREAATINRADAIVLTFGDYLGIENQFVTDWDRASKQLVDFVRRIEDECSVPILAIGTGYSVDSSWTFIDRGWSTFKDLMSS